MTSGITIHKKSPTDVMHKIEEKTLYQKTGYKQHIEVRDDGTTRSLYFEKDTLQSSMDHVEPHKLSISYTRFMLLPLLLLKPKKVLIIGLGGGSFLRFFRHFLPEAHIEAVDFSAEVIKIAKEFFLINDEELHCCCGKHFLEETEEKYDLILVDAFDQQGMAKEIYCSEFFRLCHDHLQPGGAISCNTWSQNRSILQEVKDALSDHFSEAIYLPVPQRGNIIALTFKREIKWHQLHSRCPKVLAANEKFDMDFSSMISIARRANISLWKRLISTPCLHK
ncbi:spermine/spermidine synthase domain-containing protein [Desulfotalea psychrophila]|uniref:Similar to spermidine synthase n=1 Tax=Desulfotalea psychrophila (strain LSv54 / DSM 12343) TaxID=177439 RepID=Q6AIJ4_DESPS|nr:methyltransferase domain-containing protein [Desulfotalea psychrophila]CAG37836.1 similar to spermidine synthase [Desulfotalea psychrophila LSv54]